MRVVLRKQALGEHSARVASYSGSYAQRMRCMDVRPLHGFIIEGSDKNHD
ncbi:MAG: hypothetical protein ACI8W7_001907 [Gammaproteobacteria bacterium]|jgi:hypothetical protein